MMPWQKKEKKDSLDFGAKRAPRSGGGWTNKGDMKTLEFSFDSKDTKHNSFKISQELWDKITDDAYKHKPVRTPALSIQLKSGLELVVLTKADFMYMKELFERYLDLQ
jgi:hypothetical protein